MSATTPIQWCDSTVNPIMGCGGCELFPNPATVLAAVAAAINGAGQSAKFSPAGVKKVFQSLVDEVFERGRNPHPAHKQKVTTTNIWHLRERFRARIRDLHGPSAADAALDEISRQITCYAAKLHLNKGANILDREGKRPGNGKPREVKEGYAPTFEDLASFGGRAAKTAALPDLLGMRNPATPWKHSLPRMIFVSDMGDAFSRVADFPFLKSDVMPAIASEKGKRHLWLWLTKRPATMARFARDIGGFPPNVCAMTTLTGPDPNSLKRLQDLRKVEANIRGLSIEPLWNRIPTSKLNLNGIDWMIVGGESGSGLRLTRPFAIEWAEELREHCRKNGVAFFLKQLGRNPIRNGDVIRLKHAHGGDWNEWEKSLRTREFPQAFHAFRKEEVRRTNNPRPVAGGEKKLPVDQTVTRENRVEFRRLDRIVKRGVEAFADAGEALARIHDGKLWRAGGHTSWDNYCRNIAGMSRVHAHRLMQASHCLAELKTFPTGDMGSVLPVAESQVRPLLKLEDLDQKAAAWSRAVELAEDGQPTAMDVQEAVIEILPPEEGKDKPEPRNQRRMRVLDTLKKAIRHRAGRARLEEIIAELEELM